MTRRRNRVAALLAATTLLAGGATPLAAAREGIAPGGDGRASGERWTMEALPAADGAASSTSCPSMVSCGSGCFATLQVSVCILSISWTTGVRLGGVQIGPSFRFECYICECWYTYTGTYGHELFKRTTDGSCRGDFPGLILE